LVGSAGRLVEQKDYPSQLRALALARKQAPELRMVLAGEGPLRGELERLAGELGVAGVVTFLGHCDHVPLLLRALDVFVLASIFEPYGVALLEALAAGPAVVATCVNEIPEIVADGRTGLLVGPRAPEELAAALVRLAQSPELRQRLGHHAVADARQRFSLDRMVQQYQGLYDSVRSPRRLGRWTAAESNGRETALSLR